MFKRCIGSLLMFFTFAACHNAYPMDSLVTADWLYQHLDDPDLVVLDTTVKIDFNQNGVMSISSGRGDYEQGHIPTAGFADLTNELVDTSSPYPYAIPTPEKFATAMSNLGVGDNTRVVLYVSSYSSPRAWCSFTPEAEVPDVLTQSLVA